MKKNIAVSAVAVLLAITGCQNTDIALAPLTREFRVEVSVGDASRTHIDENGAMTWSDGDQIYVGNLSDGTTGGVLTLVSGAGSPNAVFAGIVTGSGELEYSVFPVPGQDGKIDLTTRKASQPNVPLISTFEPGKPGELSFDKTCGVVRLELSNEEKAGNELSLNTKDTNQPNLGGTAEIVFDEETKRYKLEYTRGTGGVTITDLPEKGTIVIPVITTAIKKDANNNKVEDNIPEQDIELTLKVDESETDFKATVKEGAVTEEGVPDIEINGDGEIETTPDTDEPAVDDSPVVTIENSLLSAVLKDQYDVNVTINANGHAEIKETFIPEIIELVFDGVDEISFADVEKLEALGLVRIIKTNLKEVQIPDNLNVRELHFDSNADLTTLSFEENTSIQIFTFRKNGSLQTIHLDELTGLKNVEFYENDALTEITLPEDNGIAALFVCFNPKLKIFDLTRCGELLVEMEVIENRQLTKLDVSGCSGLEKLICHNNALIELDASGCTSLRSAEYDGNPLTDLNLSGCTSLSGFELRSDGLVHLNLSGCTMLKNVRVGNFNLLTLNLSACPGLYEVECDGNRLTELDLTGSPELGRLYCGQQKNSITLKLKLNGSEAVQQMWSIYQNDERNKPVELEIVKDWEQGEGNTGGSSFENGGYY